MYVCLRICMYTHVSVTVYCYMLPYVTLISPVFYRMSAHVTVCYPMLPHVTACTCECHSACVKEPSFYNPLENDQILKVWDFHIKRPSNHDVSESTRFDPTWIIVAHDALTCWAVNGTGGRISFRVLARVLERAWAIAAQDWAWVPQRKLFVWTPASREKKRVYHIMS